MENKSLILLLSGNKDKIIAAHNLDASNLDIVKIDDKHLSNFKYIKSLINTNNYQDVYFVAKDMYLQRFHFFMLLFILIFNSGKGAILDENKKVIKFNYLLFFIKYLPFFMLEIIVSTLLVIYYYIKIPYIKWKLIKSN